MGRKLLPLDPGAGPVQLFACELRALRSVAGEVPFWKLARRCAASKSALAAAVSGRELPSDRVARALVEACGGDWAWWGERLAQARALAAETAEAPKITEATEIVEIVEAGGGLTVANPHAQLVRRPPGTVAVRPDPIGSRILPRRLGTLTFRSDEPSSWPQPTAGRRRSRLLALVVALAAAEALVLGRLLRSPDRQRPHVAEPAAATTSPGLRVLDGNDPYLAGCGADQQVVQKVAMAWPNGKSYGALTLYHSAKCNASWGSVDGPNSATWSVYIVAHRPADGMSAPSHFSGYSVKPGSWGNMLLTTQGCVWVEAYVILGTQHSHAAQSFCYQQSGPVEHADATPASAASAA